jgi:hypothetical protein
MFVLEKRCWFSNLAVFLIVPPLGKCPRTLLTLKCSDELQEETSNRTYKNNTGEVESHTERK